MNVRTRGEATSSLVTEVLHSRGALRLRATGVSMLPTLWPGDLLTIQFREFAQVQVGDLVLYTRAGRFFIHRVVRKAVLGGEPALITRGDCMAQDDPSVCPAELLGAVTEINRGGSRFAPTSSLGPFRQVLAHLLCHWDVFRRIVLRLNAGRSSTSSGLHLISRKAAS